MNRQNGGNTLKSYRYKNRQSEDFTIEVHEAIEGPDHWRYPILARHQQWGNKSFTAVIKKSEASDRGAADLFLMGHPLDSVRDLLDQTHAGSTPMQWDDTEKGWAVIPA